MSESLFEYYRFDIASHKLEGITFGCDCCSHEHVPENAALSIERTIGFHRQAIICLGELLHLVRMYGIQQVEIWHHAFTENLLSGIPQEVIAYFK